MVIMDKAELSQQRSAPGEQGLVRIDGARVRRLREAQGVTQLYLATAVGVTTDTISRWENKHYSAIKADNGQRLAQALEVELAEIIESGPEPEAPAAAGSETAGGADEPLPLSPGRALPPLPRLLLLAALFLLPLAIFALWFLGRPPAPETGMTARRSMPAHTPVGQPFPVVVTVRSDSEAPLSLLVKESLPPGVRVVAMVPPGKVSKGELRWLGKQESGHHVCAYLAEVVAAPAGGGDELPFTGSVLVRQGRQEQAEVAGAAAIRLAPFHWADGDQDGRVSDDEILLAYDEYIEATELPIDVDLVDEIWMASSYRWQAETGRFIILP
ncbi:MAG: helix-turn-helix transcriptional regulator [Thermodesulfobacteriota bacterium]